MSTEVNAQASSPFDDPAHADLVLQSNDNVNFFVYKLLLSLVSPVFKDMFAMPQPESDVININDSSHPVVPVGEDSETLNRILSWCDPRCSPVLGSVEDIQVLLRVADKYCMENVMKRVGETLAYGLEGMCPMGVGSVRIYAIAIRYRLDDLAQKAAKCSLACKLEDHIIGDVPELAHIPAIALHRLQQYRLLCGAAAKKVALDWSWIPDATGVVSECRSCASGQPPRHWSKWWVQYMALAADELYRYPSGYAIVPELAALPLAHLGSCDECGRTMGETNQALLRFNKALIKEIERVVAGVPCVVVQ
ncbi:hypothetical protein B0H10DRAFT_2020630 [Mycena sp. CBHHK59/15]|nr:hypothetical protein B0H10DRAFT_2020630 [Mycena sp. CBHHK59/15]